MGFVRTEIGFDPKLSEIESRLKRLVELESEFYIIQELTVEFRHEWKVFDFFLSGFKVTKDNKILTAREFGLD
jgi:hypothetical protein